MADAETMDTLEPPAAGHDHDDDGDLRSTVMARFQNSAAPEHRHLCAVVGAMAQVIGEQGLPPSPTAYFAATMSSLERQRSSASTPADDPVTTALCTFLAMLLPKTSPAVLRSKSRSGLSLLVSIIEENKLPAGAVKPALTSISTLICSADKSEWPPLAPSFNVLLKHCLDQRPKVRKRAHECVAEVLHGFQGLPLLATASDIVVTLFEKSLLTVNQKKEANSGDRSSGNSGKPGTAEALQILYLLNAMKLILPLLTGRSIAKLLSNFSKLLELRQPFLTRQILNTMQPLCANSAADVPAIALSDFVGKLAGMITDEKKAGDESMVAARVLTSGMERLHTIDSQSSAAKLPSAFQCLAGVLAFEQEEAVYAAADCLKSLIEHCVDTTIIEQGKASLQSREKQKPWKIGPTVIERICVTVTSMLGYQYSSAWDVSLQVVAALFEKLGESSCLLLVDCIKSLADLEGLSDENLSCRRQLHKTIGAAVAAMGPEKFLTLLPLNIESDDPSGANLWLVPILRQNIVGAKLKYFAEKLLPHICKLQEKSNKLTAEGRLTSAKKMESYVQSLWALFPAFCNFPSDTAQNFGLIAKPVADTLSNEPELRGVICHGLQTLIRQNKSICGILGNSTIRGNDPTRSPCVNKAAEDRAKALYTEKNAKANLAAVAAFSRNFLPLLFNIFIAASPEKRGDLQVTIGDLASISQRKVVKDFFVSIMQKLLKATKEAAEIRSSGPEPMDLSGPKEESSSSKRCIFMDLALSLLQGLDDESVHVLFTAVKPTLQDADGSVQKKGYKVLAGICKEHVGFLARKADDVLELIISSMPSCHFSAKRHRLTCLHHLVFFYFKNNIQEKDTILSSFIGEIVLATKETNVKTRNTAYETLVQLGHSLKEADSAGLEGKLIQFFTMIVGCLGGTTPHMRSAAITGLARLIYEFQDLCYTIPDLLPSALLLLHSKSREVIKSVLGFLKVIVARQPVDHLQQHLKSIVDGLLLWSDDPKNHFRAKVRVIFEMLVRRCGLQAVSAIMPQEHMKLLNHIRKMKERKEKQDADDSKSVRSQGAISRQSKWHHTQFFSEGDTEDGSEDAADDVGTLVSMDRSKATTTRSKGKSRKGKKMLPEDENGGEGGPLDLLDVQRTRSALSIKNFKRKGYESDDLEMDEDGRLIVPDDDIPKSKNWGDSRKEQDDVRSMKSKRSLGSQADRKLKTNPTSKRRKTSTGWAYTGQEYASSKGKGQGDVKRQGKLDPYAYWPLDPKMLNRREGKKAAARKGLASVLNATSKMKGMSASKALEMKWGTTKGKQKLHKGGKRKSKGSGK